MPQRNISLVGDDQRIRAGLDVIRSELNIPSQFPLDAQAEAEDAAHDKANRGEDLTDVPFVTIDPPDAMDLDQALHLSRDGNGYLVRYAIADVAAFVRPGGPIDEESHRRGVTFYAPDGKTPLHPAELSEGAASLLPDAKRSALVWVHRLDHDGKLLETDLIRARVRSRAKLSYEEVQKAIDDGTADEMLSLLPVIGQLRVALEQARGGVSLPLPDQEVEVDDSHFRLVFRNPLPVEQWNAQISLLTGMAAAAIMRKAKVGILRTLPSAQKGDLDRLRRTARALDVAWASDVPYSQFIPTLDASKPNHAAVLNAATIVFRGAGYFTFDGTTPRRAKHAAIADHYAHVTAPLRRLADRYALEICAAAAAGEPVPDWVRQALKSLPKTMEDADRRAGQYEAGCVNLVEAAVLAGREGETFDGVVVELDRRRKNRGTVVINDHGIEGRIEGSNLPLGKKVSATLGEASVERRTIQFVLS